MFVDEESDIHTYLVTVGSRPGHNDIMRGQEVTADCEEFHTDVPMINGHTYYVNVRVSEEKLRILIKKGILMVTMIIMLIIVFSVDRTRLQLYFDIACLAGNQCKTG